MGSSNNNWLPWQRSKLEFCILFNIQDGYEWSSNLYFIADITGEGVVTRTSVEVLETSLELVLLKPRGVSTSL